MKEANTKKLGRVYINAYRRISEEVKDSNANMNESIFLLLFTKFVIEEWEKIRGR